MTRAICWQCGAFKSGSWKPCTNCSADPISDDERIISLFLSDHYHNEKSLNALHVQITSSSKNYVLPNELREKLKPILNQFSEVENNKDVDI